MKKQWGLRICLGITAITKRQRMAQLASTMRHCVMKARIWVGKKCNPGGGPGGGQKGQKALVTGRSAPEEPDDTPTPGPLCPFPFLIKWRSCAGLPVLWTYAFQIPPEGSGLLRAHPFGPVAG